MKKVLLLLLFSVSFLFVSAEHLKGGFFTYRYLGPGSSAGTLRYQVTLTVYMICTANSGQLSQTVPFTFFDAGTGNIVAKPTVSITQDYRLRREFDDVCIQNEELGCYYRIIVYNLPSIDLPANSAGYVVSYQRCCRITGINNIVPNSSTYGNTYSIKIPGASAGPTAQQNNSATFLVNDTAIICKNSYFETSFSATDTDDDSLTYSFCNAWSGGGQSQNPPNGPNSAIPDPAAAPQSFNPLAYPSIPYAGGFTGTTPLGPSVTINPITGLISGVAPVTEGEYVITVCVNEYRGGVLIAATRKELHIIVGDCSGIQATLDPSYITCDGFTLTFANNTPGGVNTYDWDFGVPSVTTDVSNQPTPTFTYSDTGTYQIKLVVNRGQSCPDSTTALAKVYPGFFPGFTISGVCINKPTQFTDTTKTTYGVVNSWRWEFGDASTTADTSRLQNPTYTYGTAGTKTVAFVVSNSKGCIDTVEKDIEILVRPPLRAVPKDTLICNGDSVQLSAVGNGTFSWTPTATAVNADTQNPTVFPSVTTSYIVQLNDQGCLNQDTVRVRVVNFVTLQAAPDTTICSTDTLKLYAITDGLRFLWDNPSTLNNPTLLRPTAKPIGTTTYNITATIGRCSATDNVTVRLVPYPVANAGPDTLICFGTSAQLNGSIVASSFAWTPTVFLSNANTLSPTAKPRGTFRYVLSAYDTLGCPKPGRDTVIVNMNPEVVAFAGRDTAVVVGQPLQLTATGGTNYIWSPPTALSNTTVFNPKAVYDGSFDSIRYAVTVSDNIGCTDEATVLVKIFKTSPQVFVPTGFTPNGDGRNDVVRPIAVGMDRIQYFRVFNRWGQKVFETTVNGRGWDGRIGGTPQATGVYVWLVRGSDYTGKTVEAKGTVTLIR